MEPRSWPVYNMVAVSLKRGTKCTVAERQAIPRHMPSFMPRFYARPAICRPPCQSHRSQLRPIILCCTPAPSSFLQQRQKWSAPAMRTP